MVVIIVTEVSYHYLVPIVLYDRLQLLLILAGTAKFFRYRMAEVGLGAPVVLL